MTAGEIFSTATLDRSGSEKVAAALLDGSDFLTAAFWALVKTRVLGRRNR